MDQQEEKNNYEQTEGGLEILMQRPLSVLFLVVFVDRTAFVVVVKAPLVPTRFRGPLSGSGKT